MEFVALWDPLPVNATSYCLKYTDPLGSAHGARVSRNTSASPMPFCLALPRTKHTRTHVRLYSVGLFGAAMGCDWSIRNEAEFNGSVYCECDTNFDATSQFSQQMFRRSFEHKSTDGNYSLLSCDVGIHIAFAFAGSVNQAKSMLLSRRILHIIIKPQTLETVKCRLYTPPGSWERLKGWCWHNNQGTNVKCIETVIVKCAVFL